MLTVLHANANCTTACYCIVSTPTRHERIATPKSSVQENGENGNERTTPIAKTTAGQALRRAFISTRQRIDGNGMPQHLPARSPCCSSRRLLRQYKLVGMPGQKTTRRYWVLWHAANGNFRQPYLRFNAQQPDVNIWPPGEVRCSQTLSTFVTPRQHMRLPNNFN